MTSPDERTNGDLKPPPLPPVTRLNRNVLLVAGMGVAVIVLAVTHVVRSDPELDQRANASRRVEPGAVASFLNDPLEAGERIPVPPPAYPELGQGVAAPAGSSGSPVGGRFSAPAQTTFQIETRPTTTPDPRDESYERALRAALRSRDRRTDSHPTFPPPFEAGFASGSDATATDAVAMQLRQFASAGADPVIQTRATRNSPVFEPAGPVSEDASTYFSSPLTEPISDNQVMAGTVLPAIMVTAMNSETPGEIVAQISRNVFDSQQRHLLIPRGTRVLGRYDSQIAIGQSRALIAWTRLIFPDGRSLPLPGLPTKDLRGASGVRSEVDNHYGRLYGQAVLLSIIGAGAQLSQSQQSSVFAPASAGQVAAGALGQELSRISMETIRRNMDVRPTLEVKPGTPFYIFLERDLVIDGPYVDGRAALVAGADVVR